MNSSTDFGICRSPSSWFTTLRTGLLRSSDCVTPSGTIEKIFESRRNAISGAVRGAREHVQHLADRRAWDR